MSNAAVAALLLLSGCTPFAHEPDLPALTEPALPDVPTGWQSAQDKLGDVSVAWINALGDSALSQLVSEAQANNRDLQAAAAAIEQARALARQSRAPLFPTLDATASMSESGALDSSSSRRYTAGFQTSWELDVWGRVRANRQAAVYSAYSAEADYVFSQYSLAAAVAQTYFLVIESELQEDVARKSFQALQETDRIVRAQRELGAASALDEALSEANLATARASLAEAAGGGRLAVRALEVLLGRYPANDVETRETLPAVPPIQPAGVPSTLLERRPDLIAAELAIASAFSNVNASRAARLPIISLNGSIDGSSTQLSDVLDKGNTLWQLASNLLGPLFDAGLRRAQVEEANAGQEQAIANYAQVALSAFQEVENSLDQSAVLVVREEALFRAAQASNRAFEVAKARYQEGETDLLDVLTIQTNTFSADSALVSVKRERLDEWVNLNLALGGSWE